MRAFLLGILSVLGVFICIQCRSDRAIIQPDYSNLCKVDDGEVVITPTKCKLDCKYMMCRQGLIIEKNAIFSIPDSIHCLVSTRLSQGRLYIKECNDSIVLYSKNKDNKKYDRIWSLH